MPSACSQCLGFVFGFKLCWIDFRHGLLNLSSHYLEILVPDAKGNSELRPETEVLNRLRVHPQQRTDTNLNLLWIVFGLKGTGQGWTMITKYREQEIGNCKGKIKENPWLG